MKNLIFAMLSILLITACGSEDQPQEDFVLETRNIQSLNFIDINGNPIANADIIITEDTSIELRTLSSSMSARDSLPAPSIIETLTSDENGQVDLDGLEPGTYSVTLTIGGITVNFEIVINDSNAQALATVAAPVSITKDDNGDLVIVDVSDQGVFFAISGIIYNEQGPIDNAQIEISGGEATNGAIAITTTDENGFFVLVINVGLNNFDALQSASVRIFKEGYDSVTQYDINAVEVASISGLNIELIESESNASTVYEESFDQIASEGTCGGWISYATNTAMDGESLQLSAEVSDEAESIDLWHEHQAGLNILNQALEANLVKLAPNDSSEGYVPDPTTGRACWYGESVSGGVTQGNFLGNVSEDTVVEETAFESEAAVALDSDDITNDGTFNGGTSSIKNEASLESPLIDLTNEIAPLSLNFKTWWEIESVNPNEDGYDLMTVEYKIEEESCNWKPLARLNPLSDPVTVSGLDRAPLPYSNAGFNKAPIWLSQEPISLDSLTGQVIRLRFNFATVDELYNGFRGWLLDDLSIQRTQGTFPLYIKEDTIQPLNISTSEPIPDQECVDDEPDEEYFEV